MLFKESLLTYQLCAITYLIVIYLLTEIISKPPFCSKMKQLKGNIALMPHMLVGVSV